MSSLEKCENTTSTSADGPSILYIFFKFAAAFYTIKFEAYDKFIALHSNFYSYILFSYCILAYFFFSNLLTT